MKGFDFLMENATKALFLNLFSSARGSIILGGGGGGGGGGATLCVYLCCLLTELQQL